MFRSLTRSSCSSHRLDFIGRLKSYGVWTCVTASQELVLFHLVRAQEQMMYARMMANHVLLVENFQEPVKLNVGQVLTK